MGACAPDAPRPPASLSSNGAPIATTEVTLTRPAGATSSDAAVAVSAEPPRMEPDASGLRGKTIDFPFRPDGARSKSLSYEGRIFVHEKALRAKGPLPLVVFFHGLNRALIPHRWMGGGDEGDVRKILSQLIESGALPPMILAGPGSIEKDAVSHGASFPSFDFDNFVTLVEKELEGTASVDRAKVVVTGHSGAGCSEKGGIVSAVNAKLRPHAVISIDTCMPGTLAESLGAAHPETHVVVTWQTATWDRNFAHFKATFEKETAAHPSAKGVLRELDSLPNLPRSHDATVKQTFDKWLPRLLPAR